MIPLIIIKTKTVNKPGVKNFPIKSTIDVGFNTKNKQIAKKISVVNNALAPGKSVAIPNSNVVDAVRGMAIIGPIAKIKIVVDTFEKSGPQLIKSRLTQGKIDLPPYFLKMQGKLNSQRQRTSQITQTQSQVSP